MYPINEVKTRMDAKMHVLLLFLLPKGTTEPIKRQQIPNEITICESVLSQDDSVWGGNYSTI